LHTLILFFAFKHDQGRHQGMKRSSWWILEPNSLRFRVRRIAYWSRGLPGESQ